MANYYSYQPGLGLAIGGTVIRFKGHWLTLDDVQLEAELRSHPNYGNLFLSEEDKREREKPDPKVEEDLLAKAMETLKSIPGVAPAQILESEPSQEPSLEQSEPKANMFTAEAKLPSLTEVTRMKKDELIGLAEIMGVDFDENDTAAIIRRKVRSEIKQRT